MDNSELDTVSIHIYSTNGPLLEEHASQFNNFCSSLYPAYIWNQEPFHLQHQSNHVYGKIVIGDSLMDEWFIVYLLRELSLWLDHLVIRYIYRRLMISVNDSDGEFLLIEAAEYLPSDLNPSDSDFRVYIHQGQLHLIPLSFKDLTREKSIELIQSDTITIASNEIQNAAFTNIQQFPTKLAENIHRAQVIVPHIVAHLLYHCPNLIAPTIKAFAERDAISMKPCSTMKICRPDTNVTCTVEFTKLLYAKLSNISCIPPPPFKLPKSTHRDYKPSYLGMKLACGFEILLNQVQLSKNDYTKSDGYRNYFNRLEKLGYFKGEIEGSKLYKQLKNIATLQYLAMQHDQDDSESFLHNEINRLMNMDLVDVSRLCIDESDNDEWMTMNPNDVDQLLSSKNVVLEDLENDLSDLDEDQLEDLENLKGMLNGFHSFVDKESDVKGALFPNQIEDDVDSDEESDGDYIPVNFDGDTFLNTMQSGMNSSEPDNIEEDEAKKIELLMAAMDRELSNTHLGQDFERQRPDAEEEDDDEDYAPVDVDGTLIKNLLESFKSQEGFAGPVSNILGSLGLKLPKLDKD
ncbi:SGT1 protein-domain-containing protein [Globomyces pollinis-pini]|nr:SGT1 protein-domain-containing protein [Globomyces pollinis-pini]